MAQKCKVKNLTSRLLVLLIVGIILITGCIKQQSPQIDTIQINFTHYIAGGDHYLKINSLKRVKVSADKVNPTYYPPFPSIQVYAVYSSKKGMTVSPSSYLDVRKEGNLSIYVVFEPNKMPLNNSSILVVVEVRDSHGKLLATDKGVIKWG